MQSKRTKNLFKIIVGQSLVLFLIVAMSLSILFYAEGYRVDFKHLKFYKTGIIYLSSNPKGASVYIDNKLQKKATPFAKNLIPGRYNIRVEKNDYHTWYDTANVESELVADYKPIILIKKNIQTETVSDDRIVKLLNSPEDILALRDVDGLAYNDYEIWISNTLVTRFSKTIEKALWYSDKEHIIFQQESFIEIIDRNGRNQQVLVELSSSEPTNFFVNDKGDRLYYLDQEKAYVAYIR